MIDVFLRGVLPQVWLSPNRGERKEGRSAFAISAAKSAMRGEVCLGLLADESVRGLAEPITPCHVILTLRWWKRASDGYYRPLDIGNAIYSLKAAIDGIVDAGVMVDDDYRHLALLSGSVERCEREWDEGLRVQVLPIE